MNFFILRVLNKLKCLKYFNFNVNRSFNGKKFNIPLLGETGITNIYMSEIWMIEVLKKIIKTQNGIFVDVGVNTGQTLLKLKSVNIDYPYIGFEPNPVCINYLTELLDENQFSNTSIVPVGLSDKTLIGEINYFHKDKTDTTASIVAEFRPDQRVVRKEFVPLYNSSFLDNILQDKKIGILKIDVEGAELEVLKCFKNKLKDDSPLILLEILPAYSIENIERINRQNKIQAILKEKDYLIYRIIKMGNSLKKFERIAEFGIHKDIELCDYLCIPKTKKEAILE